MGRPLGAVLPELLSREPTRVRRHFQRQYRAHAQSALRRAEGIVIFDDYEFDEIEDESERPKLGIDAFLKAVEGQYRLMHKAYQVVIAKL